MINPGSRRLLAGDTAVLITTKQTDALRALRGQFHPPSAPSMAEVISDRVRYQVFQNPEADYFSTPEAPLRDPQGEACVDPPFIGQLETESVDDGDGVCLHLWDVVDRGWGGEDAPADSREVALPTAPGQHTKTTQSGAAHEAQSNGSSSEEHGLQTATHAAHLTTHPQATAPAGKVSIETAVPAKAAQHRVPPTSNNGLDSDAYSMLGAANGSRANNQSNGAQTYAVKLCTTFGETPWWDESTPTRQPGMSTPYDELGTLQPTAAEYSPIAWDVEEVRGHVIVCGSEHSFVPFMEQLRASSPNALPVVFLHPARPTAYWRQLSAMGPIFWVQGSPSETASLRAANAQQARALVFLTHPYRPKNLDRPPDDAASSEAYASTRSRAAVLADSDALLTCYGVGEDSGMERLHSVVELTFTSSVRFLQPGLLLKGVRGGVDAGGDGPRRGWRMRKAREAAAVAEGLAEWQVSCQMETLGWVYCTNVLWASDL